MLTGLTDIKNLQAKEIEERQNDEDKVEEEEPASDQEEIYNNPYCQEFINNDESGVHCSKTTRLPFIAHKASYNIN